MLAPGLFVWHQLRHRPGRRDRGRGRRPAMAVELPPARARTAGSAPSDTALIGPDNPLGARIPTIPTARTTSSSRAATCICRSASRSRCCCAPSTCCTISTCPSSAPRWTWCPGMVTYFWFTPTRTGTFEVLCAELCGIGHRLMRGVVVVDERERLPGLAAASSRPSRSCGAEQADAVERARARAGPDEQATAR